MSEPETEPPPEPVESRPRCENCGRPAGPEYCPHCGQALESHLGPLRQVGKEALSDWLALDSRLFRSLRALVVPGHLSELYIGGRRAPFLRPFRLYLLASLILFSTLLTLESVDATNFELYVGGQLIGEELEGTVKRSFTFLETDHPVERWLVNLSAERIERLKQLPKQEVVDIMFKGLRRTLPLTLILFVPFLALALKLLYHPLRRKTREKAVHTLYLDHLVFSLHYQSALFFFACLAWLVTQILRIELPASAFVYVASFILMILVYLPMALRRFYKESRWKTALKTFLVLWVYSQLLGISVSLSALYAVWRS